MEQILNAMLTFPFMGGLFFGLIMGFGSGLFYSAKNKEKNLIKLASALFSLLYFFLWVYWNIQAGRHLWLPVPWIFDAIGGMSAALILGIDINMIGKFLDTIIENFNRNLKR